MTSVLSANPSARISTDLAGPDLWSVADGPVISRATIHVALQPVHHDSGTRSHTRAAALVRGVLTIPVGSARSSSARKCSPRRHPLPHRYALGSLLLGALVFGMQVLTTAPSSSPQVRGVLPVPVGSAHRWSAESPHLYTLLISLYTGDELLEVIATLDCH